MYEFVTGKKPSRFFGKNRPVEQVDWYDAVEFCNTLSKMSGLESYYSIDKASKDPNNESDFNDKKWLVKSIPQANGYRLPTEAEWEYAARGGKHWEEAFEYAGSDDLKKVGWYDENSHAETLPVGLKAPNQLGLYDMSGNVWEWCWNWYGENYYKAEERNGNFFQKLFGQSSLDSSAGILTNPLGAEKGASRVVRGGSWGDLDLNCRVALHNDLDPYIWYGDIGFRIFRAA